MWAYIISGGLYRGDVSEISGTCLIWSGRSSWAIWYLSFKNPSKNETVRAKKWILGWGCKGGLVKNGFTQILFISKASKINFMSWDTDLGPMSPFPLLNLHIRILPLRKRHVWSILGGVHDILILTAVWPPTLGENSYFKLLNWRKSQKKQILKIWRLPFTVSSLWHV